MNRLTDRLYVLHIQSLSLIIATCMFCSAPVFGQDGGTEPSAPEPVLEEEDDIVIPDEETEEVPVVEEAEPLKETPLIEDEQDDVVIDDESDDALFIEHTLPTEEEIAEQAKQLELALGQALVQKAQAAAQAGKWRESATMFVEANKYIPNDSVIIQGLQHAYSMLDQGSLLGTYEKHLNMEREAARAMFEAGMSAANEKLMREDYDNASQEVQRAIVRLERDDRRLFSEIEFIQRIQNAKTLLAQIALQQEEWQQQRLLLEAAERNQDQALRQSEESQKRAQLESRKSKTCSITSTRTKIRSSN